MAAPEPQRHAAPASYDARLKQAEEGIALSIVIDRVTRNFLRMLMEADGQTELDIEGAVARFVSHLTAFGTLTDALVASTRMYDELYCGAIRDFLLNPKTSYTFEDLAILWRVSLDDVFRIYADTVTERTALEPDFPPAYIRVPWYEAIETTVTYNLLSSFDVERALGPDFLKVRTDDWRTRALCVRLPLWLIERLEREPMIPSTAGLGQRVENILHLYVEAGAAIGKV